jgi:hypothetical protein
VKIQELLADLRDRRSVKTAISSLLGHGYVPGSTKKPRSEF